MKVQCTSAFREVSKSILLIKWWKMWVQSAAHNAKRGNLDSELVMGVFRAEH